MYNLARSCPYLEDINVQGCRNITVSAVSSQSSGVNMFQCSGWRPSRNMWRVSKHKISLYFKLSTFNRSDLGKRSYYHCILLLIFCAQVNVANHCPNLVILECAGLSLLTDAGFIVSHNILFWFLLSLNCVTGSGQILPQAGEDGSGGVCPHHWQLHLPGENTRLWLVNTADLWLVKCNLNTWSDWSILQLSAHCPCLESLSLSHCELITDEAIR